MTGREKPGNTAKMALASKLSEANDNNAKKNQILLERMEETAGQF